MTRRFEIKVQNVILFYSILFLFFASPVTGESFSGRVVHVIDGDSLKVLRGSHSVEVRLYGIDCPEIGQDFGFRAKKFTSSAVLGETVHVTIKDRDSYGRAVGMVTLTDGANLNYEIVKHGFAWWYRRHASREKDLRKFEKAAREERLGLWVKKKPLAPWKYRKAFRRKKRHKR